MESINRFRHTLRCCCEAASGRSLSCMACRNSSAWFGGAGIERTAALLQKFGYPAPLGITYLVACVELFGGALLVIGLFVRPVAFAMVIFMLFAVHFTSTVSGFIWFRGGCEYSLAILFISFFFLIHGAGPFSLDRKIGREF